MYYSTKHIFPFALYMKFHGKHPNSSVEIVSIAYKQWPFISITKCTHTHGNNNNITTTLDSLECACDCFYAIFFLLLNKWLQILANVTSTRFKQQQKRSKNTNNTKAKTNERWWEKKLVVSEKNELLNNSMVCSGSIATFKSDQRKKNTEPKECGSSFYTHTHTHVV